MAFTFIPESDFGRTNAGQQYRQVILPIREIICWLKDCPCNVPTPVMWPARGGQRFFRASRGRTGHVTAPVGRTIISAEKSNEAVAGSDCGYPAQQQGDKSGLPDPFAEAVPGFFGFLRLDDIDWNTRPPPHSRSQSRDIRPLILWRHRWARHCLDHLKQGRPGQASGRFF